MGIGDELMLAGEAKRRAAGTARRYRMLDKFGQPRWHFVWDRCAHVAKPGEPCDGEIGFSAGKRPYVVDVKLDRYSFREYAPAPAEFQLGPQAQSFSKLTKGCIVFNPTIKHKASPNKQWGLENWKRLIALGREFRWVQIGAAALLRIRGAEEIPTFNFWDACGALAGARAAVLHEGALHHAAASTGTLCVVIYGGFISPRVTGYAGQAPLFVESERWPLGCGMRVPCGHCRDAMDQITPETVLGALRSLLITNHESRITNHAA